MRFEINFGQNTVDMYSQIDGFSEAKQVPSEGVMISDQFFLFNAVIDSQPYSNQINRVTGVYVIEGPRNWAYGEGSCKQIDPSQGFERKL